MRLDRLKTFALSLPHATVTKQWGETLVFKVGGKMFLVISLDGETAESLSFKSSPADFKKLTNHDGIIPAPYLARASWVALEDLDALPSAQLQEEIRKSYDLVLKRLPKKTQAEFAKTSAGKK
jgi:predicted DNA-binding protein (MmcQ/YjbR family)